MDSILENHPLQSVEWEEFRGKRQKVSRVDGMLIMWTKIAHTPWCFGYIPMGKIPDDMEELRQEGKRMGAIGIRMEPNLPAGRQVSQGLKKGRGLFKKKTIILDLTKSEEELLKNMHSKGRYNIKVAQKHGVSVRETNKNEDFEKYLDLMFGGTAKRQGIYAHGRDYHRAMRETLKMAHLFVAEYDGKVITADLIFKYRDGIYYAYGASALEHKEVMAPTLLLWEIAKWGKACGCKCFDLWGAEEGKGFSRFKEQFGGEVVELVGSYDLPINTWLYPLFRIIEEVRWKILRILK
jgi:lipid II:glycine glycyltransferase (peptidoglycan interpeptide bridge formation enzyme)